MKIKMAHLREQGIDFAVFGADARNRTNSGRDALLADLTAQARLSGLKVDKAALQYGHGSRLQFYGSSDLVRFLASAGGVHRWTHEVTA